MNLLKKAIDNSSKNELHINMFGWGEKRNLHELIYNELEWHARRNIGVRNYARYDYENFRASDHDCPSEEKLLSNLMYDNGFCQIFSKASEEGYDRAFDVIQKWCN